MRIRIEKRPEATPLWQWGAPVMALILSLVLGIILFSSLGFHPLEALYAFFIGPISNAWGMGELVNKATPIMLCATGLMIGFRANVWNIGAEGQFLIGALAAGALGLAFWEEDHVWLVPAMALAGILGGMLWALPPAVFKTRFGANEILTSLMLVYVASLTLDWAVRGPLKDPDGFNFPESRIFHDAATIPNITDTSPVGWETVVALIALGIVWFILSRTAAGFRLRLAGASAKAAAFAGVDQKAMVIATLLIGGGFAGLAGAFEVSGTIGQLTPFVAQKYGFTAIIVAFLGRLHPVGVLLSSLLIALTYLGGEAVQIDLGLPKAIAEVFQGFLLFSLLGCTIFATHRIRILTGDAR